jgi:methyltransferase (TIGR00027 family)
MRPTVWAAYVSGYRPDILRYPFYSSPSLLTFINARTTVFDQILSGHLSSVDQVVILDAKWDTRAYTLLAEVDGDIYEVDAEDTQRQKQEVLRRAGIDASAVTFVSTDIERRSLIRELKARGFDPTRPTLVLWEGGTYAHQFDTVEGTLQAFVERIASEGAIAFDYVSLEWAQGTRAPLGVRVIRFLLGRSYENHRFGISTLPPAQEEAKRTLGQFGLRLVRHMKCGADGTPFGGICVASQAS